MCGNGSGRPTPCLRLADRRNVWSALALIVLYLRPCVAPILLVDDRIPSGSRSRLVPRDLHGDPLAHPAHLQVSDARASKVMKHWASGSAARQAAAHRLRRSTSGVLPSGAYITWERAIAGRRSILSRLPLRLDDCDKLLAERQNTRLARFRRFAPGRHAPTPRSRHRTTPAS